MRSSLSDTGGPGLLCGGAAVSPDLCCLSVCKGNEVGERDRDESWGEMGVCILVSEGGEVNSVPELRISDKISPGSADSAAGDQTSYPHTPQYLERRKLNIYQWTLGRF